MPFNLADAVATPTAFLNLCRTSLVRVIVDEPNSGQYTFGIREEKPEDYKGWRRKKGFFSASSDATCKVFSVFKYKNQPDTVHFRAYWCGYKIKSMQMVVCGTEAPIMLTARMDGCTFGVGSRGGGGERLVCHVNLTSNLNARGVGGQTDVGTMDGIVRSALGDDVVTLTKTTYNRTGTLPNAGLEMKSTTFGVRDLSTNEWSFHYLSYGQIPGGRKLYHFGCNQFV